MASYNTNEFKNGLKIMLDGDPCSITENILVKPGKGQAFNRVKVKNLKTGRTLERTFKATESVEAADVEDIDVEFLYTDGEYWHFMEPETYEQHAADSVAVGDSVQFTIVGDLAIIDRTHEVTFTVEATAVSATEFSGTASTIINREEFNLIIPSVPNVANVETEVELYIDFTANAS